MKTILGIYTGRDEASSAIDSLQKNGYKPQDISIMVKDKSGEIKSGTVVTTSVGDNVASGAVSGATTGGVIGGLAGLLIGLGAISIPGLGAFLIGGPLIAALGITGVAATTVSAAATGVFAGGIVGALVGLGLPEDIAQVYEQKLKEGAILLALPIDGRMGEEKVKEILTTTDAQQIRIIVND